VERLKSHIGYKISLIILVIALLVPSFVKLAHAFETHKHEICKTPQKSHYHNLDLDCEFYKFKLSTTFSFQLQDYSLTSINYPSLITNYYKFNYSNSHIGLTSLRGPPELI